MPSAAALFFQAHCVFAIVVIAASVLGHSLKKATLPLITGYLLTGVLSGPFILDIIHTTYLKELSWINEAALAVIAFCAGAELYLPDIRKLFTIIMMHVSMITVFTLTFVPAAVLAVYKFTPFLKDFPLSCVVPIAFLCGSLMLERSPSGALAMINEMMSQGPITKTLLGVTIVSDVALLTTFAVTSSFASAACGEDGFNSFTLVSTLLTLMLCGAVGYVLGKLMIFFMWLPRLPQMVRGGIVLPLGYLVFFTSKKLEHFAEEHSPLKLSLEPILCCVIASCVAGNATSNRRQFANILHTTAPYIFVPFFALSGANMNLPAMAKGAGFALVLVFSRILAIFCATFIGGKYIAKESAIHYKFLWMTLLPQAGPLLGLVNEIKEYGEWARELAAACIAALIINHIVGLKLFKWALVLVGEAFKAVPKIGNHGDSVHDAAEEAATDRSTEVRIFGINNVSMAIASKLASTDLRVEIVASKLLDSKTVKSVFERRKNELLQAHPESKLFLCHTFLDQHFVRKVWLDTYGDEERNDVDLEMDNAVKQNSLSYLSLEPILEAICPIGCHTLIFTFPFDQFNYMTCKFLSVCRKLSEYKKVIVLIRDPNMAPKFEKLGAIPVYCLSAIAEVCKQISEFDDDNGKVELGSTPGFWSSLIHQSDKSTTCKLRVNDLNGDFAGVEDYDLDNFSKLNAMGLADAAASALSFKPKFEYPLPLDSGDNAGGDAEIDETERNLRARMKNFGKIFRRNSGGFKFEDEKETGDTVEVKTQTPKSGGELRQRKSSKGAEPLSTGAFAFAEIKDEAETGGAGSQDAAGDAR